MFENVETYFIHFTAGIDYYMDELNYNEYDSFKMNLKCNFYNELKPMLKKYIEEKYNKSLVHFNDEELKMYVNKNF